MKVGCSLGMGSVLSALSAFDCGFILCVTLCSNLHRLLHMIELIKISDPVSLQILSDVLASKNIIFRVENAGMNALMPLPTVMEARVLVAEEDAVAARLIVQDMELNQ